MTDRPISAPLAPNERIKETSNFLRGTIAEGLTVPQTGAIADDDQQLTKFHGIYLQDDRDLRAERGKQRMEKAFIFMARMRVPSGILTPAQYLAADRMARERGNGTLRLTTRQTIQFHGIIKSNLRPLIQGLYTEMLDTIAACGDVNRNVCASVDPWRRAGHAAVTKLAGEIATHLLPRSRAWHEIWIGEERVAGGEEEAEPIYGRTYMPRKFKIGVALPPHNDIDVFAQDLSFVAIERRGKITGYDVIVGGGMGMTHGEPETYPRNGDVIGFCKPEHAIAVAEAVVTMQRDHGDRSIRMCLHDIPMFKRQLRAIMRASLRGDMEKVMASFLDDGSGLMGSSRDRRQFLDRIMGVLPVIGPDAIPAIDHFRREALCRLPHSQRFKSFY